MNQIWQRCAHTLAALALGLGLTMQVGAQSDYPNKPITLLVPYPAGGSADQFARALAQGLGERLGQTVVVANRPGANGNIGSANVARQQPADGYTLLLGTLSTLAINPHLYASMGYDPIADLQPITLTHQMPNVLLVNVQTPYQQVADVVAAARAQPGALNYGSAGNGNTMHLAGVLFERQSNTRLAHVPYKGGAPALADVMAGQIPMMFNNLPAIVAHHQAGRVRVLAVADAKRAAALPDVPTFAESGVPDVVSVVWNGILVRRGTPQAIVRRLNQAMVDVLNTPAFRAPLERQGYEVLSSTPEAFSALLIQDTENMRQLVKGANIQLD